MPAVDVAANTVTRFRAADGRVDIQGWDQPHTGLRLRAQNACSNHGAPLNCSQTVQLPLQGMGMGMGMGITVTVSSGTSNFAPNSFFFISPNKPN